MITEKIENGILINGDCIEALKSIESNTVDFTLTDPPFNVKLNYSNFEDNLTPEQYLIWCNKWINELYRISKSGSYCLIFSGDAHILEILQAIKYTKWNFAHFIKWYKPASIGALRVTCLFNETELGILLYKDHQRKLNRKELSSDTVKTSPGFRKKTTHPAERPLELYEKLIKGFSYENELVIDPFLGSGTTALACKNLNRKYIGIELNPEYILMVKTRLC